MCEYFLIGVFLVLFVRSQIASISHGMIHPGFSQGYAPIPMQHPSFAVPSMMAMPAMQAQPAMQYNHQFANLVAPATGGFAAFGAAPSGFAPSSFAPSSVLTTAATAEVPVTNDATEYGEDNVQYVTKYVDEAGNPVDPSVLNTETPTNVKYVDQDGNPVDPAYGAQLAAEQGGAQESMGYRPFQRRRSSNLVIVCKHRNDTGADGSPKFANRVVVTQEGLGFTLLPFVFGACVAVCVW